MLRLACSGPLKAEQGPAKLRELALRESIGALIQQAAIHWRTPSEWAEEASPYARQNGAGTLPQATVTTD
jgi:hypothetical protein